MLDHTKTTPASDGSAARMSMDEVRAYMSGHYHEPLSIELLAQLAGLSPNYFGEAFKKATGRSVMDYLTGLRIGRAKQLIRETDLYMREVARSVGYSDEYYFSRKFKKEVGVSPSVFGRSARQRIAALSASSIGYLLPLGIVPVAAPLDPKWSPYYHYYYQSEIRVHLEAPDSGKDADNIKSLMAAKPDAVLIQESCEAAMEEWLASSAIELIRIDAEDWRGRLWQTAKALGRSASADRWIRAYESNAAQAKQSIREAVGADRFLTLRLSGDQLYMYVNRGIRDVIYRDLELAAIPRLSEVYNEPLSVLELAAIDPDRLMLLVCPDAGTRMQWLSLQHDERWRSLKAVKNRFVYQLPSNPWFEYSPVAVSRMLEETVLLLTGKNPTLAPVPVHGRPEGSEL
ncbi:helix-turn-helix domain-containing protein [Paenibacillus methanolicus]|uniref:ABC-type Fe3+-hydroxamate transport system substrate-binding protein n=1 Tax=Paenibacillus methanolicus TaxID=582686 RepID=A0A5S5C7W6_9BACL|nr:helix-turn-helix domain-containing protein [Paenibacillus methanolicus]TYP74698.1 ABC-type Fe3+-hydroxamate transport system substrate-binding protein [Paenibacillus methanolicus]